MKKIHAQVVRRNDKRVTPGDKRGVFYDLFSAEEAAELAMRAELLRGLQTWLTSVGTQTQAAKMLDVTQARVSDIKRGKIGNFSLDLLVRLAARAGLQPELRLAA
jgi:predicted XRE-type DNA-binding protein